MNILVLLPLGGSLEGLRKQGQSDRFVNSYLRKYNQAFKKVFVASFKNETAKEDFFTLLPNNYSINRFLYGLLFPFFHIKTVKKCQIIRVMQISSLLTALICKLISGAKVYVTYGYNYEQFAVSEKKFAQAILFRVLKKLFLFMADKVFFPVKSDYRKYAINSKAVWLPNGVDMEKFTNVSRKSTKQSFDILYVGRLEQTKRLDCLFNAVLKSGIKTVTTICLVGSGTLLEELKKKASLSNLNVNFMGNIPNDHLPPIYKKMDLFVLPSEQEGVSKVLLEAMASALPVVARDLPVNRDILENNKNGFLFSQDNGLPQIIKRIYDEPELRKRIGENARKTIESDYNLSIVLDREISLMSNG